MSSSFPIVFVAMGEEDGEARHVWEEGGRVVGSRIG